MASNQSNKTLSSNKKMINQPESTPPPSRSLVEDSIHRINLLLTDDSIQTEQNFSESQISHHQLFSTFPKSTSTDREENELIELFRSMSFSPKPISFQKETNDDEDFFQKFFAYKISHSNKILTTDWYNIVISSSDLNRLQPGFMLNDVIINFAIELFKKEQFVISKRKFSNSRSNFGEIFVFNTYFSPLLSQLEEITDDLSIHEDLLNDFARRKLGYLINKKKFDITKFDTLLIPIHRQIHWSLFAFTGIKRFYEKLKHSFRSIESLSSHTDISHILEERIVCFALDSISTNKKTHEIIFDSARIAFTLIFVGILSREEDSKLTLKSPILGTTNFKLFSPLLPQQTNGVDCGMAVIENIERILFGGFSIEDLIQDSVAKSYDTETLFLKNRIKFADIIIRIESKADLKELVESYFAIDNGLDNRFLSF